MKLFDRSRLRKLRGDRRKQYAAILRHLAHRRLKHACQDYAQAGVLAYKPINPSASSWRAW